MKFQPLPIAGAVIAAAASINCTAEAGDSIEVLQRRLVNISTQNTGILARADEAGRDLTADEQAESDALHARFESTAAAIAALERDVDSVPRTAARNSAAGDASRAQPRRTNAELVDNPTGTSSRPAAAATSAAHSVASQWRDKSGAPVLCLAPGESVQATLRAPIRNGRTVVNAEPAPSVGETIRALATGDWSRVGEMRNAIVEGGGDASGGVFVVPEVATQLIDLARAEATVFRAGARTLVMRTNEVDLVKVVGDVAPGWVPETNAIPKSDPTFGRLAMVAHKLAVICTLSRELAEDAPNASSEIQRIITNSFAMELDRVALLGSGTGAEPLGVYGTSGVQTLAVGGATSYDTLLAAISLIEAQNGSPTASILSPHAAAALRSLKESGGAYLMPPAVLAEILTLVTSKMANDKGIVGDFRQLIVGMRTSGIQFEVSQVADTAFVNDLVLVKARMRVAIGVVRPNHFVKMTGIA